MENLGASDFFEVRKEGGFSSSSLLAMGDLYLPLLGTDAFAAYFALLGEREGVQTHEHLLQKLQLSPGEFYKAMLPLEAVGLVKTYYNGEKEIHYFIYELSAPLEPQAFLSDVLFKGVLATYVGEKSLASLEERYGLTKEKPLTEGFKEVSESFPSYFAPNLSNPLFKESRKKGRKGPAAKTLFDYREFQEGFEGLGGRMEALTQGEMERIDRLSALYCLDSRTIAQLAFESFRGYSEKGKRIDFASLEKACRDSLSLPYLHQQKGRKSRISSDSATADLLRFMDNLEPTVFLSYLQKGHKPGASDLKVIGHLANDLGLSSPAINALLWFTLLQNENELPYGYCDKVGAALVREDCRTSRDAWEYLYSKRKERKQAPSPSFTSSKPAPSFEDKKADDDGNGKQVSDAEVDAAFAELFGGESK